MNATQIHLALTHVPVILSFVGLVILVISFFRKNDTLIKTSIYILLFAGIFATPVYYSGEGTEEAIENLPGVSESIIEEHEEFAKFALIAVLSSAIISLAGLILHKYTTLYRIIRLTVLVLALVSTGIIAKTAHLGGQIRHSEIRNASVSTMEKED